jgi:hypothetical protein
VPVDPDEFHRDKAAHITVPCPPGRQDRDAGLVRLPQQLPVAQSYLTQCLQVQGSDGAVEVVPVGSRCSGRLPFRLPAHVLSAWSTAGRLDTAGGNIAAGARLREHLDTIRVAHHPAASYAPDRSWAEGSVVTEGIVDDMAATLGRLWGQAAVVRFDANGVHVVPTGLVDFEAVSLPGWVVRPARETCPMRREGEPGQRCRNPGGPWVSRSMEVSLVWEEHRQLLTGLLGCGVCRNGTEPSLGVGRAIGLTDLYVANRWGGWQFA